jgi:glucose-fructose oxidoreductase
VATFTSSFAAADASFYRVVGTEGHITVDPAFEYAEPLAYVMTAGGRTTRKKGRKHDQFGAELLYFSECIANDREPEPSGQEGAWEVRIIDAIYESARRGEQAIALRRFVEPGPERAQQMRLPPVERPELVNAKPPHD